MPFLVKSIKPKKLKSDVFRLEFLTALRDIERAIIKEFNNTTKTWKGAKPTFKGIRSLKGGEIQLLVGPAGDKKGAQKWVWADEGTKPHIIRPVRAKKLRFNVPFVSKTIPRQFTSRAGSRGDKTVFADVVRHPGNEPREWTRLAQKKFQPIYKRRMERAMKIAVKKSGHGI